MVAGGKAVLAKSLAAAEKSGVKPRSLLVEEVGRPAADLIVEQARQANADLIVIGTHGRKGIQRLVVGSVAEGVVRQAKVPVMLVPEASA